MTQYLHLGRLHVEDLGDTALHDQEMWIVHIQLHRTEQVLDTRVVGITAVDEVLVAAPNHDLTATQTTQRIISRKQTHVVPE